MVIDRVPNRDIDRVPNRVIDRVPNRVIDRVIDRGKHAACLPLRLIADVG
jgi:hypothetical protein